MSREVIRRFAPFLLILLVAGAEEGLAQVVIDAHRHHLGTAGRPEWREFAGADPEGRGLELRFEGRANPAEATLLIRQRDVKLGWDVRLNDRRIGQLHPMEAALVHALAVPAGTLRDGGNRLTIGPPPGADDVIIEGVALDPRPVREALGRATLEVRVAEPGRDAGLPCRITVVDDRGALAPLVVAPGSRLAARPGVVYTPDGRARIGLPPGRYTVSATRGFEYGLDTRDVDAGRGPAPARGPGDPPRGPDRGAGRLRHARPHPDPQRPRRRHARRAGRHPGRRGDRAADRHRPRPPDVRPGRGGRSHGRLRLLHAGRRRRGHDQGRALQRLPLPGRREAPGPRTSPTGPTCCARSARRRGSGSSS